ncbi:tRNA uridine(34) 5-carboxymethylaminomethyl modification radical SAM/GNAT enzyme Elp3 [Candidatus Woesearchaeota archaeon B3_Woes]|nr:MAG: tRNA uridine(34) 5-carboxymethylaminomethyl modification radical SAM/GNAT enzyme Elp3 [Candidatus Woesearchaeota archaeon B3_Woes]
MNKEYIKEIVDFIRKEKPDKHKITGFKTHLSSKYKLRKIPNDIEVLLNVGGKDLAIVKKYLLSKETRTISGVAVCAIMTKPLKCPHGKCLMCPGGPKSVFGSVPQSYTGKEPATRRAIRNLYDPYLQVMNRLEQYIVQGHTADKVELIVMGGTFPSFNKKYREDFVMYAFKAMNDFSRLFFKKNELDFVKFKRFFELPGDIEDEKRRKRIFSKLLKSKNQKTSLEKEQKLNESSNIRCVGLTIETRPDYGGLKHGKDMLRLGCTRVELGVQSVFNPVLEKIKRGHSVEDSIESTRILKDLGFKINYHMMLGLPGVNKKKDLENLKILFEDGNFQPDMLKLYPCMVLRGTKLYNLWKKGKYKPITTKQAIDLIVEFKKKIPEYVRVMRVQRDIPTFMTKAGVDRTNLRQYVDEVLKKKKIKCRCIRCREIGRFKGKMDDKKIKIKTEHYKASKGNEFFISAEYKDYIVGFCRLRFPSQSLVKEITKDSALIRELHVYGSMVGVGKKGEVQHKGVGRLLVKKAENIAKTYYKNKVVVISGVGVRNYYRKLGYKKEGPYMVKSL